MRGGYPILGVVPVPAMPANPPTAPNNLPARDILLVEEYDALGVAIAAALRKFAPRHAVRLAHNFAAAEAAAAAMPPELFVLDLDPPQRGEIAFFNRLQKRFPDARVLVLVAVGISRELRSARGAAGAIQFIEKPFELAEFGAAVRALLGRWAAPPSTEVRGTLRDLHAVDIIQLKCLTLSTAVVRLENPQRETGEIHFRHGQVSHAAAGVLTGVAALEEIVGWPRGKLRETELPSDAPKTINQPWATLLLQVIRQVAKNGRKNSLGAVAARPADAGKTGKKILVIDDTEMLLIFAADVLGTTDQTYQIITASTGGEGLKLATAARPDLVLLDYSLTDMNGDDVCRDLLANERTARIPVLMMSGHLAEMATTAKKFGNVVATLAKPFLSGTLISAVTKVLAAGPLPKSPSPPPLPKVSPAAPAAAEPLPNEHSRAQGDGNKDGVALDQPAPAAEPPVVAASEVPRPPIPAPVTAQPEMISAATPSAGRTQVSVTFALEVISMQLTPLLRVETLKLRLADVAAEVKMSDRGATGGMALETGFRLGSIGLSADGRADTIRIIPTRQPPQLVASERFFAVGGLGTQPANPEQNLQLTAPERTSMRVQLTAQFELLMVELSDSFEVVAVLLRSSNPLVRVSNQAGSAGAQFELQEMQLDPWAQLETLSVRAAP